jgi:hypothetical protein
MAKLELVCLDWGQLLVLVMVLVWPELQSEQVCELCQVH